MPTGKYLSWLGIPKMLVLTSVWAVLNGALSQPKSLRPKIFIESGSKRWQELADIFNCDARKHWAASRNLAPTLNSFRLWLRRGSGGLVVFITRFCTTGSNLTGWGFMTQTRKRLTFLQSNTGAGGRSQRLMESHIWAVFKKCFL